MKEKKVLVELIVDTNRNKIGETRLLNKTRADAWVKNKWAKYIKPKQEVRNVTDGNS